MRAQVTMEWRSSAHMGAIMWVEMGEGIRGCGDSGRGRVGYLHRMNLVHLGKAMVV